jgi:hypothetical protein
LASALQQSCTIIVVSGEPYPIEYDRDLKKVASRIQLNGPAYESINAMKGNVLSAAVYTVRNNRPVYSSKPSTTVMLAKAFPAPR